MPFAECPKCGKQTKIESSTDGQGVWCPYCGNLFKAHLYRISAVKDGEKLACAAVA